MKMNSHAVVSALLKQEKLNYNNIIPELERKTGKKYSRFSISAKLGRGTFSYDEMLALCEILGYEIKIEKL